MRSLLLASTALVLFAVSDVSAHAAAAPDASSNGAPSGAPSAPQQGIETVTVTAERRTEDVQRAALPIDVVSRTVLVNSGVTQVERLNELTPALSVQNGGSGAIFFMRGVGNFTVTPNADPATAFSYDDVYIARPSSTVGLFYDLDRIEVLMGPQGTLYGRNATGGAINLIPTQPQLGELGAYGVASFGNFGTKTFEGAINVPLEDDVAIRASTSIAQHDGYLRDGTQDQNTISGRFQIKAVPTDKLTIRLAGDYSHSGGVGFGSSYLGNYVFNSGTHSYTFAPSGLPLSEGFFTPSAQAYTQTIRVAGRSNEALAPYPFQDNSFYGVNAEIAYDTDIGTLTIIPAWRHASLNYLTGVVDYRNIEQDEQYSVEARFVGERVGIFDYTIGGIYFDESIHELQDLTLSSALALSGLNYATKSGAVFGRVTANLTDRLRLVGGLRYTQDNKSFNAHSISGVLICPNPVGCPNGVLFPLVSSIAELPFNFPAASGGIVPQFSGGFPTGELIARTDAMYNSRLTNSRVTYHAGVEFDVAPQSLAYASYDTGYHSGGFSPAAGFETFKPEYVTAYTIGLKNTFLDNTLQLNVEGFYWDYTNQQFSHVGLDTNGKTANFTQNIGRSRMQGAEVEAHYLITPSTLVSADVQYLSAKDVSFSFQQGVPTPVSPPPLSGCAVSATPNPMLYNENCAGKPAFNSPVWTMNLAGQQTVPIDSYELVFGVNTQLKSARYVGIEYLPQEYVGWTSQTNAQISFGPSDERWSLALFVHNIENDRVITGSALQPVDNVLTVQLTEPRLFGVRLSAKY